MKKIPVKELNLLSKDLDIFKDTPCPDSEIINLHLYPPLPVSGDSIIWGFHLLKKAVEMGIKYLHTVTLPNQKKLESLKLSLKLEARSGQYLWEEKERMVQFVGDFSLFDSEIVLLIEGQENAGYTRNLAEYISLNPAEKDLVSKNQLDIKTASRIKELPDEIFVLLEKYKKNKKLTFSNQRILLTQFLDVVKRDKLNKDKVIALFKKIISKKDPVSEIGYIRYPQLSNLIKRFEAVKMNILKGTGVKLEAPPYFEGDSYNISFNFKSKKQLSRKIAFLKELESKTDELFKLL